MEETICAISTANGIGAISIIRVSGINTFEIVNKIFSKNIFELNDHSVNYGFIKNQDEKIDEVLLIKMNAPKTYTKEDMIEINCHGGIATTNKILELLLENGCKIAEPGEFTKRAYLNGRIDLSQAEAINDLLYAKTESARKVFLNGITGIFTKKIDDLRNIILDLMSNIEVNIDYPEYEDNLIVTTELLNDKLIYLKEEFEKLLRDAKTTKIVKEGINVALIGKPNVGKSSLLNSLLNEEKAIVSNIEGTTRDIVEGSISLNGVQINLIDTAGIRETINEIEKIGVEKSKKSIENADLVIFVIDSNKDLSDEEKEILNDIPKNKIIIFANKDDISPKKFNIPVIYGNTRNISGIRNLKDEIIQKFNLEKIENKDITYLNNIREIDVIKKCLEVTNNSLKNLKDGAYIDMIEIDLNNILQLLGTITGNTYENELIDKLFANFCLGK